MIALRDYGTRDELLGQHVKIVLDGLENAFNLDLAYAFSGDTYTFRLLNMTGRNWQAGLVRLDFLPEKGRI